MTRGTVLIVGDGEADVELYERVFRGWPIARARSFGQAVAAFDAIDDLWLALLDDGLPETACAELPRDNMFVLASVVHERWPRSTVVIVTGSTDLRLAARAQAVESEFLFKLMYEMNLWVLAERLERREKQLDERTQALARMSARCHLTPRESRIAALAMDGMRNHEIADELGISRNTMKTHVRRLLEKTGAADLSDVRRSLTERRRAVAR
jgi:DNA-binding NarL/FixJ family response regulator